MEYIHGTTEVNIQENTVISLGKFDGLHTGHKFLMEHVMQKKQEGLKTVVFTFDLPPKAVVEHENQRVLTTNTEKMHLLEKMGIDYLIEYPFTPEMMAMEPEAFIRFLVEKLHVKCIVAGKDFRFGHNRKGDYHMLQKAGEMYGFETKIFEKRKFRNRDISSTYIREEILEGNMELAEELLGYPYFVQETVIQGQHLGRTIGIPTVNLLTSPQKLLPPCGVYISHVYVQGKRYGGITNIGRKPTVGEDHPIGIETNIFDFDGDLYGKEIKVELLHFVRSERRFPSVDALKRQMMRDMESGKKYLQRRKSL
ncbi:MAG: bifunctional riboflavin kinase/FAD synthetase [Lachnospiraceae bacterium]